jgi:hypothetical protein
VLVVLRVVHVTTCGHAPACRHAPPHNLVAPPPRCPQPEIALVSALWSCARAKLAGNQKRS